MSFLFLDDERNPSQVKWGVDIVGACGQFDLPPAPWDIVCNYDEFVKYIDTKGVPVWVAFDHDLADEHYRKSMYDPDKHYSDYYTDGTFKEKTGKSCADYLVQYCVDNKLKLPEQMFIHSMNPIGRENIQSVFKSAKRTFDFL